MADMTPITYAAGAYTAAQAERPRPEENRQSQRFRLVTRGQRLPRRQPTRDLAPLARGLQMIPPKQLRDIERQPDHTPRPHDRAQHPLRMDEECLRYTSQTKRNFFFGVIRGLGMVGFFLFLATGVLIQVGLFIASWSDDRIGADHFIMMGQVIGIGCSVSLMAWGGANLIYRLFPNFAAGWQPGPLWELNRRTGQVTVFTTPVRHGNAWQVAHVLPFHEFDCYLQSTPSHQGLPQFNLILAHYSREAHVALVGMFGASSRIEQQAAWDMLQRYMDTSQPLPDLPVFEMYRELDPTTLTHDRRSGRDPRYWRDMDDATFRRKMDEHQQVLSTAYRGLI